MTETKTNKDFQPRKGPLDVKVGDKVRTILARNKSDWWRVRSVNDTDMVVEYHDMTGPCFVPLVSPLWEKIEA